MKKKLKNGNSVLIPDEYIDKMVDKLGLSIDEACELWLDDNGLQENEEQKALDEKAKKNRITATIHQAKATTKEKKERKSTRKEDTTKESLIKLLAESLATVAIDIKIENVGKLISFKVGDDEFKLDLKRTRKPKG